ncbi:MAG: exported protein of unknown function [Bryobacterales bacterium]|nr:exported protein of unknown function [Bryobacterales bacterium]
MTRAILTLLLLSSASAAAAGCDAAIGDWRWFNGGSVTITQQKTVLMNGKAAGKWDCADPKRGATVVRWDAGFVDNLTVAGNRMTGKNQQGVPVSADRKTTTARK